MLHFKDPLEGHDFNLFSALITAHTLLCDILVLANVLKYSSTKYFCFLISLYGAITY